MCENLEDESLQAEIDQLRAENARLHDRLEDNHEYEVQNGEMVRVDVEPGSIPDKPGIAQSRSRMRILSGFASGSMSCGATARSSLLRTTSCAPRTGGSGRRSASCSATILTARRLSGRKLSLRRPRHDHDHPRRRPGRLRQPGPYLHRHGRRPHRGRALADAPLRRRARCSPKASTRRPVSSCVMPAHRTTRCARPSASPPGSRHRGPYQAKLVHWQPYTPSPSTAAAVAEVAAILVPRARREEGQPTLIRKVKAHGGTPLHAALAAAGSNVQKIVTVPSRVKGDRRTGPTVRLRKDARLMPLAPITANKEARARPLTQGWCHRAQSMPDPKRTGQGQAEMATPAARSFLVRHAEFLSVVVGQMIDVRSPDPIMDPIRVRPDPGGSIARCGNDLISARRKIRRP
jgi:hypothetical protein